MKQYLIVRSDLNMRKGKICSQCAHASNKILLDSLVHNPVKWFIRLLGFSVFKKWFFKDALSDWLNDSFTKIVLNIPKEHKNQENVLDYLFDVAKQNGCYVSIIEDNGLTEFHGVKTKTVVGIGPFNTKDQKNNDINEVLSNFKLL